MVVPQVGSEPERVLDAQPLDALLPTLLHIKAAHR
jgi:hypothetical protein